MQTPNFNIDLMTPMQFDREIIFNEAILKLDNFCNIVIKAIVDSKPEVPAIGDKYIIKSGPNINQIYFCSDLAKGWQNFIPKHSIIAFILKENCFYLFDNNKWQKIDVPSSQGSQNSSSATQSTASIPSFKGVKGNLVLDSNVTHSYLYLDDNITLNINNLKSPEVTFIIKQNFNNIFKINWPSNVLWQARAVHKMSEVRNAIDLIKMFKMAETNHFIGHIIGQNYQY